MTERVRYQQLAAEFGVQPSREEAEQIVGVITRGTYLQGSRVGVPPLTLGGFGQEFFISPRALGKRLTDIFRPKEGEPPGSIMVLAEEDAATLDAEGLSQFPFGEFLEKVVPYIRGAGDLKNYWATDGNTVVTFHHSGIVYWNTKTI